MSKKLFSLLLAVCMIFCLSACGTTETSSNVSNTSSESQTDTVKDNDENTFTEENSQVSSNTEETNENDSTQTQTQTNQSKPTSTTNQSTHTHSYSNATCTSPKKCSCGLVDGNSLGHNYTAATCTTPKTCLRCGEKIGLALEHSYSAATCITPKTCARCGNTNGSALGHKYIAATCTSPKSCERCNSVFDAALGHNFQSGSCSRCGKLDRTYLIEDIDFLKVHDDLYYNNEPVTDNKGVVYSQHYNFHSNMFAYSRSIYFDISGKYSKFNATSLLGYDYRGTSDEAYIKIYGDDKLIYQSSVITMGYSTTQFSVDVTGVSILRIEMESSSSNINTTSCVPFLTDAYLEK